MNDNNKTTITNNTKCPKGRLVSKNRVTNTSYKWYHSDCSKWALISLLVALWGRRWMFLCWPAVCLVLCLLGNTEQGSGVEFCAAGRVSVAVGSGAVEICDDGVCDVDICGAVESWGAEWVWDIVEFCGAAVVSLVLSTCRCTSSSSSEDESEHSCWEDCRLRFGWCTSGDCLCNAHTRYSLYGQP